MWLICVLLFISIVAAGFMLTIGVVKWPVPVIAVIFVISVREWRIRSLNTYSSDKDQMRAVPWGIAAGTIGFFVSQLPSPTVNVGMLAIGALGIGGAIGFFTSLFANSLVLTVPLLGSIVALLRDGR
jgi:hypothetical protein